MAFARKEGAPGDLTSRSSSPHSNALRRYARMLLVLIYVQREISKDTVPLPEPFGASKHYYN